MRVHDIVNRHRAAAVPRRPQILALPGTAICGGFFRRINVGVPLDDHRRFLFRWRDEARRPAIRQIQIFCPSIAK